MHFSYSVLSLLEIYERNIHNGFSSGSLKCNQLDWSTGGRQGNESFLFIYLFIYLNLWIQEKLWRSCKPLFLTDFARPMVQSVRSSVYAGPLLPLHSILWLLSALFSWTNGFVLSWISLSPFLFLNEAASYSVLNLIPFFFLISSGT